MQELAIIIAAQDALGAAGASKGERFGGGCLAPLTCYKCES